MLFSCNFYLKCRRKGTSRWWHSRPTRTWWQGDISMVLPQWCDLMILFAGYIAWEGNIKKVEPSVEASSVAVRNLIRSLLSRWLFTVFCLFNITYLHVFITYNCDCRLFNIVHIPYFSHSHTRILCITHCSLSLISVFVIYFV